MDLVPEILKFGAGGLIGAVFFWLYLQERKDHGLTRDKLIASIEARREDSKESVTKVTDVLNGMSIGIKAIGDKIEVSKGTK